MRSHLSFKNCIYRQVYVNVRYNCFTVFLNDKYIYLTVHLVHIQKRKQSSLINHFMKNAIKYILVLTSRIG